MDDIKEDLENLCGSSIELFNAGDYEGVANLYKEETQFLAPILVGLQREKVYENSGKIRLVLAIVFKT